MNFHTSSLKTFNALGKRSVMLFTIAVLIVIFTVLALSVLLLLQPLDRSLRETTPTGQGDIEVSQVRTLLDGVERTKTTVLVPTVNPFAQ